MEHKDLTPATEFCIHYQISYTVISGLAEAGLIEVVTIEEQPYLHSGQLAEIEKLIRFHSDLDINMEGIEAVSHLLERIKGMRTELKALQQRLQFYEDHYGPKE